MKTPKQLYQSQLEANEIQHDALQAQVVDQLESIYDQLTQERSLLRRLSGQPFVKGLYMWGDVGAGKTFLMDLFYEALPFSEKLRLHFHVFMRDVHEELKQLQGKKNPLKRVAKNVRAKARVLCFDEFHVNDIADAMLLRGFLEALFNEGVVLVTTSNVPPIKLYWKGLQRQQFLPVIALLEEQTEVVHLDNAIDYRLRYLNDAGVYHVPLSEATTAIMTDCFRQLAGAHVRLENRVRVAGRDIPVRGLAEDIVWFDFHAICGIPRSQRDYIEISRQYKTVMMSGLEVIKSEQSDLARSLINLVDVFYDAGVNLICSASVAIEEIYPTGPLAFEFKRCISRMIEMRSEQYLEA